MKITALAAVLVSLIGVRGAAAQQTLPIHLDDPVLRAALVPPIPTTNTIPAHWSEVTCFVDFQTHWSTATGRMRHAHFGLPCPALYNEVADTLTTPFRWGCFQTDGRIDAGRFEGDLVSNVIWDATGTSTPPDMTCDPRDGAFSTWTGVLTLDFKRTGRRYSPPPHGWFNVHLFGQVPMNDGTDINPEIIWPLFSTRDASQPESPADPSGPYPSTYPRTQVAIYGGIAGDGNKWGVQIAEFRGMLPTFGVLKAPFTPQQTLGYMYAASEISELIGTGEHVTSDVRIGEDLHHGIPGTIVASAPPTARVQDEFCCPNAIPFTIDPATVPNGLNAFTINWNIMGGPASPDFPDLRMAGALFKFFVNTVNDGTVIVPPPPPPPPPADWQTVSSVLQRLGDDLRILLADGKALLLGTAK